jgi:hypothetical protein
MLKAWDWQVADICLHDHYFLVEPDLQVFGYKFSM